MKRFLIRKTKAVWTAGLDFLLPPLCLNCETPVATSHTLCADCWKSLRFVGAPYCACCGAPFDLPVEEGTLCGACLDQAPSFAMARSALLYDDASRGLLLRFKHADRLHLAPALSTWMVRAGGDLWGECDVLIPVPLHRWRLLKRRYNQAAVLAVAIGRAVGKPVAVDAVRRVRSTESQGHKDYVARRKNVKGAFVVARPQLVAGRRIVLVDDVLTSGATVQELAKVLLMAGAVKVNVVTLARTRIAS